MKPHVRILLYAVLVIVGAVCTRGFYSRYHTVMSAAENRDMEALSAPVRAEGEEMEVSNPTGPMLRYGAGLLFVTVFLALMGAHDLSRYFGSKAEEFILTDGGEAMRDPDYEEAEKVWANGKPLEAIQLMRDHLKKHPRHQYVAIRIAEIYEKDLGNHVAAALEYEQILQHKLPAERWGWAAVHLANLYSGKLNRTQDAEALLRRIVKDYGQTAAAKKARERLGESETVLPVASSPSEPAVPAQETPPASNLPPGFRPKTG